MGFNDGSAWGAKMTIKNCLKVAVSAAALTFSVSAVAHDVSFDLTNNSKATLVDLRLSGSSDPSWGPDTLEEEIPAGEDLVVTINGLEECEYDMRAVYSDGDTEEVWNMDLCELDDLTITDDDIDKPDPVPESGDATADHDDDDDHATSDDHDDDEDHATSDDEDDDDATSDDNEDDHDDGDGDDDGDGLK